MFKTARKRLGVTAVLAAALAVGSFALTAPAASAATSCSVGIAKYESSAALTTSVTSVNPGDTVTIKGTGFPPNSEVPLSVGGTVIGTAVTDATGDFLLTYTVPANAPSGVITFSADCGVGFSLSTNVTVSSATTPTTSNNSNNNNNLPVTGSSTTLPLAEGAIALVVAGGLVLLVVRKRSAHEGSAS